MTSVSWRNGRARRTCTGRTAAEGPEGAAGRNLSGSGGAHSLQHTRGGLALRGILLQHWRGALCPHKVDCNKMKLS
jgi:hypothetical protein